MNASIDVTKIAGYKPNPHPITDIMLIPCRHACGRVLYADLSSDYPVFYPNFAASLNDRLIGGYAPIISCPHCSYPLDMDWMRPLYLVEPMPYSIAIRTCSSRVCSNCWGQLVMSSRPFRVEGEEEACVIVQCATCKYETAGYVTTRWVGHAREKDYLDYGICVIGLSEALELSEADGIPVARQKVKLSVSESIAMLGF